jgi:hypothetical protein
MREYTTLWFKQSLSRSLTIGDTISGVVGIIVGIMGITRHNGKTK